MTDSDRQSLADIARAAAERIRWEMENGVVGYAKNVAETAQKETAMPTSVATVSVVASVADGAASEAAEPAAALEALHRAIGNCTRCDLHRGRTRLVFGEGNPSARVVFVGEGPGRDEDSSGRPFVGAAGQLLDKIIGAMGLSRDQVYICNVVKCRPPDNRPPTESESNICGLFMRRQLSVIRPQVVVALGSTAAAYLLGGKVPISRARGRFHEVDGIRIMPTYHPAYLLRNPAEKRAVWNDMQAVMQALGLPVKSK